MSHGKTIYGNAVPVALVCKVNTNHDIRPSIDRGELVYFTSVFARGEKRREIEKRSLNRSSPSLISEISAIRVVFGVLSLAL